MSSRRKKKVGGFSVEDAVELLNHLKEEKPLFPLVIPLILLLWFVERWLFSLSNWLPLIIAVWATVQVLFLSVLLWFYIVVGDHFYDFGYICFFTVSFDIRCCFWFVIS